MWLPCPSTSRRQRALNYTDVNPWGRGHTGCVSLSLSLRSRTRAADRPDLILPQGQHTHKGEKNNKFMQKKISRDSTKRRLRGAKDLAQTSASGSARCSHLAPCLNIGTMSLDEQHQCSARVLPAPLIERSKAHPTCTIPEQGSS